METTAQYRKLAQEAEQDLKWGLAVVYWNRALTLYPNLPGQLAEMDKNKIRTAINADMGML